MGITDELREMTDKLDKGMEELGFVRLPLDANGEPIHIGDTLDGYNETTVVKWLMLDDDGWSMGCENGTWLNFAAFKHHHEPTVEDLLREFALACEDEGNAGPEVERLAAKYADRIRKAVEHD